MCVALGVATTVDVFVIATVLDSVAVEDMRGVTVTSIVTVGLTVDDPDGVFSSVGLALRDSVGCPDSDPVIVGVGVGGGVMVAVPELDKVAERLTDFDWIGVEEALTDSDHVALDEPETVSEALASKENEAVAEDESDMDTLTDADDVALADPLDVCETEKV